MLVAIDVDTAVLVRVDVAATPVAVELGATWVEVLTGAVAVRVAVMEGPTVAVGPPVPQGLILSE